MPIQSRALLGVLCASVAVYLLTPVAIRVAGRFEFYDKPAGYKGHSAPTPYLGGAAVMAGFLLALLTASLAVDARRTLPLAGGVALLWLVGTIDDRRGLSPALRVAVELALAGMLWGLGLGWDLGLGFGVDLLLTSVWIVGVVNAFNLFDNMDGATSTMALVIAGAVALLGLLEANVWLAATAAALAGSCLGFLPHNMASPARIFLGDGGSMPLGFAVAALVMVGTSGAVPAWQALVVGLLLVGIPALDTALVVVSRRRRGIPILTGDRRHLTHRTQRRVRTARLVAMVLGAAQAIVAALAVFSAEGGSSVTLMAVLAYLLAAGTTIVLLEAEETRRELAEGGAVGAVRAGRRPRREGELPVRALLVAIGLGAALSTFWFGFYDSALWVPIGLGVVTACASALVATRVRLTRSATALLATSTGLALWTLLSSRWGESAQQAVVQGNRALVAIAVLALVLILCRTRARAAWLVGALGAGVAVVAIWVLVHLLAGDRTIFVSGRLNQPFGYINAQATVGAIGLWIAVAVAERRRPAVAGPGAAAAVLLAGLLVLTASRGGAIGIVGSTLVVFVALPGRLRRIGVLVIVVAAVLAISGQLLDVYDAAAAQRLTPTDVRGAGTGLLVAALVAGLVWALLAGLAERIERRGAQPWRMARRGAGAVVAVAAIGVALVALLSAGRIANRIERQYDAFTTLGTVASSSRTANVTTRLVSGGGNRYDYWRIAWGAFRDRPVAGIGAGNYDVRYFRQRTTPENVRQPHSIELQVLSETGLVGGLLLLGAIVAGAFGLVATGRRARTSRSERTLAVAAAGGASAWIFHTSVDWMHLLPGVTAMALCLLAVLMRGRTDAEAAEAAVPSRRRAVPLRIVGGLVVAAIFVLAGAALSRQGLAEHDRGQAATLLARDPAAALREANRSLKLDGDDVRTYYVKAAALARFDRGDDARAVLGEALAKEPHDFVTWALLGDLATRQDELDRARRYYGRAHELNPLDRSLTGLARNPTDRRG